MIWWAPRESHAQVYHRVSEANFSPASKMGNARVSDVGGSADHWEAVIGDMTDSDESEGGFAAYMKGDGSGSDEDIKIEMGSSPPTSPEMSNPKSRTGKKKAFQIE